MKYYSSAISITRSRHKRWLANGTPTNRKLELPERAFLPAWQDRNTRVCICSACRRAS